VRQPRYVQPRLDGNERFRERRRRALARRRRRRLAAAIVLLGTGAGLALGATSIGTGSRRGQPSRPPSAGGRLVPLRPRAYPQELRGIHVTMALAGIRGRIDTFLALERVGLNALEVDVKDENGYVAFRGFGEPALARAVGAARPFYDPVELAAKVHARHAYLIGRVVVFDDPILAAARPQLALDTADGSPWTNNAGLGWLNEYSRGAWKYAVDVGAAAARAGFDEIQFDYVRFPSDGDLSRIVYRGRVDEPKGATIARFLAYASRRLHPLGVRVSADVFGLSATHDLGVGQVPRRLARVVDSLYPMVYPSHYSSGEYGIRDPNQYPGRVVEHSLLDFRRQVKGTHVALIPWLQDFSLGRPYTFIEVTDQIAAARRQHARGFLLWNPEGDYTREALADS
jgi:hypothetical protein